LISIELKPT